MGVTTACVKCEGFNRCKKYCTNKVGESIAVMISGVPAIQTRIGTPLSQGKMGTSFDSYKYCGISVDKKTFPRAHNDASPIDIAHAANDINAYQNPFHSSMDLTAATMIKNFLTIVQANQATEQGVMNRYYSLISGRLVPTIAAPEDEISMTFEVDGKTRQESGHVATLTWKPDKSGDIKLFITCETKALSKTIVQVYTPEEFFDKMIVDKYRQGLKQTIKVSGLLKMSDTGFILPLEIKDKKHKLFLDGYNLIYQYPNGDEVIAGRFDMNGTFTENQVYLEEYKNSDAHKVLKKITPFIGKIRKFILPHGVADDFSIDATEYLKECKKYNQGEASQN